MIVTGGNFKEFAISAPPSTVGPHQEATFEVAFTPAGPGVRTAQIAVPTNDAQCSEYRFDVAGWGTP